MSKTGRKPSCTCEACKKCERRNAARIKWQSLSLEKKRRIIAKRDREKVRAADRARYYRQREERLALSRAWVKKNPERRAEILRAWTERNPEQVKARTAVNNAVRDGRLTKEPCEVCGDKNVHGHHDDYTKPLDVRWLCPTHHGEHHRRYEVAA